MQVFRLQVKEPLFEYRGEIFTVPKEHGDWRNITRSTGAADRYPAGLPTVRKLPGFQMQAVNIN